MAGLYDWVKALHVVAVIAWMAALLYLPRLMVYHAESAANSPTSETFKVMERRLLRAIAAPAMLASWILGVTIAVWGGWFASGWLYAKLLLVLGLSGLQGFLARCVREFAEDRNTRSPRFYRILNEAPTVLMIAIVVLVIVKPF